MYPRPACSLPDCQSPHYGRGFCQAHWKRFKKHGDPLKGGIRKGEAKAFLEKALVYDGDDCLIWPYAKDAHGYARINLAEAGRGGRPVHTEILNRIRGKRPSPKHECCHSCGNGHKGCINHHHLYWGTRSDNVRDMIRHGRHRYGRHNETKTHCKYGHPYSTENTYRYPGTKRRACRQCMREHSLRVYHARKEHRHTVAISPL